MAARSPATTSSPILETPGVGLERRVAAAVALSSARQPDAAARIRVAAQASAAPGVRVALEAAALEQLAADEEPRATR